VISNRVGHVPLKASSRAEYIAQLTRETCTEIDNQAFQRLKRSDPSSGSDQKVCSIQTCIFRLLVAVLYATIDCSIQIIARIANKPNTKHQA